MEQFLVYVQELYTLFGWWALAIVLTTVVCMIPINKGIKYLFNRLSLSTEAKSDDTTETKITQINRLRKVVSSICVFVVAIIVLYLFQWIFGTQNYNIEYILSNCIPIGMCAMFAWAIIKSIKEAGVLPVVSWIAEKLETTGYIDKLFENIPIDKKISESVYKMLKSKIATISTDETDSYFNDGLYGDITSLLDVFNITENVDSLTASIAEIIKNKFSTRSEEGKENETETENDNQENLA